MLQETLERIHANSLRILDEVGIKLHYPQALDLLKRHGAKVQGEVARIPPQLVEDCIVQAPESFTLHAANPLQSVSVGHGSRITAPGFGSAAIIEWNGSRREASMADYLDFARLTQASPYLRFNGGLLIQPAEVPQECAHLVMMYAALLLSDQPMGGYACGAQGVSQVAELIELRMDQSDISRRKPCATFMVSPMSPLQIDPISLGTLFSAVERGHAVIVSPAPVPGITGPIELAGNLSQATAEALTGVVLAQLVQPGSPVIFGLQCYGSDLRKGNISIGSPAYAQQSRYCADLARKYGIPSRGGGTPNDARGVNARAGMESMFNMMAAISNGLDLIIHSAGMLDRFAAMSHEKFILDLEALSMLDCYFGEIPAESDEQLSFEAISQVGFGGTYLTRTETLHKARKHSWLSGLEPRGMIAAGDPHQALCEVLRERKAELLSGYQAPEMAPSLIAALDDFMRDHGVPQHFLDQVQAARETD